MESWNEVPGINRGVLADVVVQIRTTSHAPVIDVENRRLLSTPAFHAGLFALTFLDTQAKLSITDYFRCSIAHANRMKPTAKVPSRRARPTALS